ncbi:glycerol-3-phosphate acyltransferase 2, mitochondrial isoform X3 [Strigops habroptila]|uniref:glycerol-3-phosphate acyltransferase 2, mitochondrial isoform X3 n=1 Tax=Strigops habroptila TaxID=2489341 RepID=UPI0011CF2EC1|nr:glycerol-3-phosphate acyltransferase 2, mitochondrial isoform X3 [Strigops habroptila]
MRTWVCVSGQRVEIVLPFLSKCRADSGRCCQTCTPMSWDDFYSKHLPSLGFRDISRVTEKDTRFRGWLVRRVCALLAVCSWEVPADTPGDLAARVCRSRRVRDVAPARGLREDDGWGRRWKGKVLELLGDIQGPLSLLMLRICHWALLKLLSRLFLSVQLHRGQLEMVLRAASTPHVPLVFLSTHKSQLDGPLLSFVLFSQGLGVPRVTVGAQGCSPRLRSLLRRLGGIFLPSRMEQTPSDPEDALPGAVLAAVGAPWGAGRDKTPPEPRKLDVFRGVSTTGWPSHGPPQLPVPPSLIQLPQQYMEEVLRSRQPLLIFLEEPAVPLHLSASARRWLALVLRAVRAGAVPDVLLVPVGIGYDVVPGGSQPEGARGAQPLSIGACLWAAFRALRRNLGCVRVDFAQPFSLQEFVAKSHVRHAGKPEEPLLLLPTILGTWPSQLDAGNTEVWAPGPTTATGLEAPEEVLVTSLGLHSLSDSMSCSAIMSVGITSALLLHKYREGVFLSRLMRDFAWLLEEILLRQHDVGFSGQLRVLVQHSLILLRARLSLYHLSPLGDILVVPKASAETWMELGQHSAAILPVFASEAVGACAIRALLAEMLPFLEPPTSASSIIFSQDELHRKTLELLRLLPPTLLGLRPCQPLDCWSEDIVDKLVLCGLLEPEEAEGEHWVCDTAPRPFSRRQPWPRMDFSDSESEDEAPACRCFKVPAVGGSPLSPPRGEGALPELRVPPVQLGEPQGSPLFLLFLCRLLSPALRTYAGAVAFLEQSRWPQPEAAYVEELLQFLAKEGSELPNGSLALSSLQTFKEMGVLEEVGGPPGPLLHLAQPFRSSASRERLEAFIQQFIQP